MGIMLWRYLSKDSNNLPDAPFCFNLNRRPSCQTLSNPLEISRKTAKDAKDQRIFNRLVNFIHQRKKKLVRIGNTWTKTRLIGSYQVIGIKVGI